MDKKEKVALFFLILATISILLFSYLDDRERKEISCFSDSKICFVSKDAFGRYGYVVSLESKSEIDMRKNKNNNNYIAMFSYRKTTNFHKMSDLIDSLK